MHRIPELLLVSIILVTACGPATPRRTSIEADGGPSQESVRKRVVAGVISEPPTLISRFERLLPGAPDIEMMVSGGFVVKNDRYALVPVLVEEVPTVENGLWRVFPDGRMETTWRFRENITWHDGAPFSADDVLFTLQVGRDPATVFFRHDGYERIETVQVVDARSVLVRWKGPYIEADTLFSNSSRLTITFPLPRHLLELQYQANPAGLWEIPYWSEDFIGTGPYRLKEWQRGSHALLEAFDRYVLGRPRIDEIEIRFYGEGNAMIAAFLAGSADISLGRLLSLELAVEAAARWGNGRMDNLSLDSWLAAYPQFIDPNPAVILNLQFRRALMHAMDRQQMVDTLQMGHSAVGHSYMNLDDPRYSEIEHMVMKYDYDPRKATQMIEALGYRRGTDGLFRDAAGRLLQLEVRSTPGDIYTRLLEVIADNWRQAGIATATLVIPAQRQRDLEWRATRPGFEVTRRGTMMDRPTRFTTDEIPRAETGWVGSNVSRYSNPEFDALIDRYFVSIPRHERTQAAGRIVQHISENLNIMGIFYDPQPALIGNRLLNVRGGSSDVSQTWNVHLWDVT